MDRTASPRAARAALIAAALILLTLVGHTAGHGSLDVLGIALISVLAIGFGTALSARRLTALPVLGVLLAGQLLLHVVLTFTSAHHAGASSISTPLMVLGHVVAAGIATVVVLSADALVRAWLRFLAAALGHTVRGADAPRRPAQHPASPGAELPTSLLLRHGLSRRGPPTFPAFT